MIEGNVLLKNHHDVLDRSSRRGTWRYSRGRLAGHQGRGRGHAKLRCQQQGRHAAEVLVNHGISL